MTQKHDLAEIQNLPIVELSEMLSGLSAEELAALRELEVNASNRKGALEAIDEAIKAAPAQVEGDAAVVAEQLAKTPDWQDPDYTGPLDIEQMDWRNRNIKPVRQVETK